MSTAALRTGEPTVASPAPPRSHPADRGGAGAVPLDRVLAQLQPAPSRRARLTGTSTDPLSVRGCAGEELGRHLHVVRGPVDCPARFTHELAAPALRLTRRGRLLVTALSILIFGSAVAVLGLRAAGVLEPGPRFTETISVQVTPGETLWSIAQNTNPDQDPATVVERIADANNLPNAAVLTPGQTLQVPIAR